MIDERSEKLLSNIVSITDLRMGAVRNCDRKRR